MFYDHFALNHRASDNNFIRSSSIVDFFFRSRQSLVSDSLLFDRGLHGSSVPSWIIFGDQLSSVSRGRYWVIEVNQSIFLRGGFIHRGNFSSACHAKSSSSSQMVDLDPPRWPLLLVRWWLICCCLCCCFYSSRIRAGEDHYLDEDGGDYPSERWTETAGTSWTMALTTYPSVLSYKLKIRGSDS